jgi:predicted PurR-regulated permease PerM
MTVVTSGRLNPTQQKILFAVIALFLVSLYFLRIVYIPIFIAYLLAFLLNPLVDWLERRGFGRVGPIFLTLSITFALIIAFGALLLPKVLVQVRELFQRLPLFADFLSERFGAVSIKYFGSDVFAQWKEVLPNIVPEASVFPAVGFIEGWLSGTARAISTGLIVLMIPILTFYILKNYYLLHEKLMRLVPRRFLIDVEELTRRMSIVLGGLVRGQLLVCIILAAYYSVALSAVGVDMALLLGLLSGLMNLIPFVGPLASLILTISLALLGGAQITQSIAIVGVYLVANLLDTTVFTPKIVGKQMGISPITIILALLAGGELLGFLGILLALPLVVMGKVLGGFLAERYFASSYYMQEAPIEGKQSLSDQL